MKKRTMRLTAISLALVMALGALAGCGNSAEKGSSSQADSSQQETVSANKDEAAKAASDGLYFTQQEVRKSPDWVTKLDAAKDAEQLIVVAGVDKTTAYVTMHEKNKDGEWEQIIATPGFIGKDGLGEANINDCYTPVGTFTIDKAFGLADDPGCQMEYTKVDENYYWSGDDKHDFNKLVNIKDVPELDTENSEHISDYDYAYQYVLNMGYNSECEKDKGFAFFFHCFRINRTYTGGCVGVPENIMKFIMQNVKPGCKITIDSLEKMGGDLDK